MAVEVDFSGGESVYCINQSQLRKAHDLARNDPESAPRIQAALQRLAGELSRNERAAVAFVLIEELLKTTGTDISKEPDRSAQEPSGAQSDRPTPLSQLAKLR